MESTAKDGSCDNPSSPLPRSITGNQASINGAQLVNHSDITASPQSISTETARPPTSSSGVYPSTAYSTAYLSASTAQPAYHPAPATQSYSPYQGLSPAVLNSTWSQPNPIPEDSTSRLSQQQRTRLGHAERPADMSTVAIQFDPAFSMGPRPAFTWPGPLESHGSGHAMLHGGLSPMGPGSEPSLTPPATRSLTSSPPRFSLTAEQRELKRQQDKARRDSRLMTRVRRTSSPPYMPSSSPTMSIHDVSSAMNMPAYTTAAAPVSLMTEPVTSMNTSPYLAAYSPSMDDQQAQAAPVYPTSYPQGLQPNYGLAIDYSTVYAGPGHYSTPRPTSVPVTQDVGLMYQVPAVMTSGGAGSHEGGHVRVVQSRPKPRCWEHGCNGRQFSTFSNLLRHQREKSGQAAKATCPNCGAEFTRTTARNGHLLHDKCKGRRNN